MAQGRRQNVPQVPPKESPILQHWLSHCSDHHPYSSTTADRRSDVYCGDCIEDGFRGCEGAGGDVQMAGCEEAVDGGYEGLLLFECRGGRHLLRKPDVKPVSL